MSDRPKPKPGTNKSRNDSRGNGKANKGPNPHTRGTRLSDMEKILLGGGGFRRLNGVGSDPSTQNEPKRPHKAS